MESIKANTYLNYDPEARLKDSVQPLKLFPNEDVKPFNLDAYKDKGFIGAFLNAHQGRSESPECFLLGSCLTLMGAVLQRRVKFAGVFPNSMSALVAPSGVGKSYPCRQAEKLFSHVTDCHKEGLEGKDAFLLNGLCSGEALIDLVKGKSVFLVAEEYGKLLAGKGGYVPELINQMMKLYDNPSSVGTAFKQERSKDGSYSTALDPSLNVLGASSPANFDLSNSDLKGGLYGRHWIWTGKASGIPVTVIEPVPVEAWKNLQQHVERLWTMQGELTFSEEARAMYDHQYRSVWYPAKVKETDEVKASQLNRCSTNALKLAMLYAVSENRMEVNVEDMSKAIALTEHLYGNYCAVLKMLTESPIQKNASKLLAKLKELGGKAAHSDLLMKSNVRNKRDFAEALEALGEQVKVEKKKAANGAETSYYSLSKAA